MATDPYQLSKRVKEIFDKDNGRKDNSFINEFFSNVTRDLYIDKPQTPVSTTITTTGTGRYQPLYFSGIATTHSKSLLLVNLNIVNILRLENFSDLTAESIYSLIKSFNFTKNLIPELGREVPLVFSNIAGICICGDSEKVLSAISRLTLLTNKLIYNNVYVVDNVEFNQSTKEWFIKYLQENQLAKTTRILEAMKRLGINGDNQMELDLVKDPTNLDIYKYGILYDNNELASICF